MKFDFIIGNPPYQEEQEGDNKTYSPPIYDRFMDETYKLSDKVILVHPARFLFDAGSTPKEWNKKMLNDTHFKVLKYSADCKTFFPNQEIKGGIAITYHDNTQNFGAIGQFIVHDELRTIVDKVRKITQDSLSSIIFASESYRFNDLMHEENPEAESFMSKGHKYDFKTSVFESLKDRVFFDTNPNDDEYVKILGLEKTNRSVKWVKRKYLRVPDNFARYKVFLPAANGSGSLGETLSTPVIGEPLVGHTQTFISIGCFETNLEAENLLKYIKTKFARVMLGVLKITQHNPAPKWKFVPLQDFSANSDIDWSHTITDIDAQLYRKYGFDEKEKEFIETHVKEMK